MLIMTLSPFDMFAVKDILITNHFTINNIHIGGVVILLISLSIAIFFRQFNFIYNGVFSIWKMIYNLLDVKNDKNREKYIPFFFTMFIFMLISNILARVPGLLPITSLLKVSIPINLMMILYFLYCSFRQNGAHIIDIFFNPNMMWPIKILVGFIEIFSLFAKVFSFSMRLLATLTAGHVLMWVIEQFITKIPIYGKILPLTFLILVYIIELASAALQSYIFIILSINIFKGIEKPHH